jgi:hypothetical protein
VSRATEAAPAPSHLGEAIAALCAALIVGMALGCELALWQVRWVTAEDCAAVDVVAVRP